MNFLVIQCSGLHDFTAKEPGSVPGWGTKIPQAEWHWAKKKKWNTHAQISLHAGDIVKRKGRKAVG